MQQPVPDQIDKALLAGSPAQRAAQVAYIALMTLAVYGLLFSPFVPNRLGLDIALGAAAAMAAVTAVFAGRIRPQSPGAASSTRVARFFQRNPAVRSLALGAFGFIMTLLAVGDGAESVWTSFVSAPGRQAEIISGWWSGGRGACPHFEVRGLFLVGEHGLCARGVAGEAIPGRPLILIGRVSPFGINVERFELGDPPQL